MAKAAAVGNFEAVRDSARLNAPDRFYAALFAPKALRDDLIALAAFTGEIERVARQVGDPHLGEIRIAWWRETLARDKDQGRSGNPVLDAFVDVFNRYDFSAGAIDDYLEAHAQALYSDPPADDAAFESRLQATGTPPFVFAANILRPRDSPNTREVLASAGRAAALTRTALELPYALKFGRSLLPMERQAESEPLDSAQDWHPQIAWLCREATKSLAQTRRYLAGKSRDLTTALLPLALIEPHFRALQKRRHEPSRDIGEISPLARLSRIAWAHWSGRI